MAANQDRAVLEKILAGTLQDKAGLEEECSVLVEILLRKRMKNISESRPVIVPPSTALKKRKSDASKTVAKGKKTKPEEAASADADAANGVGAPSSAASEEENASSSSILLSATADGEPAAEEEQGGDDAVALEPVEEETDDQ